MQMFRPPARDLKSQPLPVNSMILETPCVQMRAAGAEMWGIAWAPIIPFGPWPRREETPPIVMAVLEGGDMRGSNARGDAATRSGPRK